MTEKNCSRCKKSFLLDQFRVNKRTGQLNKTCIPCIEKLKCEHGKLKQICKNCKGASICEHLREKSKCKLCCGVSICDHQRQRSQCKLCDGASICKHQRQRSRCKLCGGGSICEHGKLKSYCKICKGSSICEHEKVRSICKLCGGASICMHLKEKRRCSICDPAGHLASIVRDRVRSALKRNKVMSSKDYLGCDIETFKAHIEAQFKDGMTWENHGEWHIDHKIPLKYKDNGKTPTLEEVAKRLHYTNTQPLWASENIAKGNRYIS